MISLYYHLPFCRKKCPYCHFFVLPDNASHQSQLIEAIQLETRQKAPLIMGKEIASVYIGGGTPTLSDLSWIPIHGEVTVETNPSEVTPKLLENLLSIGVNRLSIGVQSLDNALLKTLGRDHTAEQAEAAIHLAKEAGFDNITIDLMYELPGQTLASWKETLRRTQLLPITHLSLYNLTFEPGAVFFKQKETLLPLLPNDHDSLAMLNLAIQSIEAMGLPRYEISAFGKPSVHNTGYWTARPFLGLGPSAFSYWNNSRFRNHCNLAKYCKALEENTSPVDFAETLKPDASINERLAVELRLLRGVNLNTFDELPEKTTRSVASLIAEELLEKQGSVLKLTPKGTLFYDTVGSKLI